MTLLLNYFMIFGIKFFMNNLRFIERMITIVIIKNMNVGFAFCLELLGLVILIYYGFHISESRLINISCAVLFPIVLIYIWSIWCAPTSKKRLSQLSLFLVKGFIFLVISLCLDSTVGKQYAILYFSIAIINITIEWLLY